MQAVVAGEAGRVDAFEAACRAGPPLAEVETVERRETEETIPEGEGMAIARTA